MRHDACPLPLASGAVLLLVLGALPVYADQPSDYAVSLGVSTLGADLQLVRRSDERVNVALQLSGSNRNFDVEGDDLNYDAELNIRVAGLRLDYRPQGSGLMRVSVGVYHNESKADAVAVSEGTQVTLGGISLPIESGERIIADMDWPRTLSPYLGFSFGNMFTGNSLWSLTFDLGTIYMGKPDVNIRTTSRSLAREVLFGEARRQEEKKVREDLEDVRFLPVATLRIGYRFR